MIQVMLMAPWRRLSEKQYESAEPVFRQVTELTPYFAGGFYNLAVCLNANGQPEPALNAFRKVLEITPEHPGALLNAGKCSMAMEKLDDAVDFFSAVIQQDSESQDG